MPPAGPVLPDRIQDADAIQIERVAVVCTSVDLQYGGGVADQMARALLRWAVGLLAAGGTDGTVAAIDRLGGPPDRHHYSGKHRRHGVNLQALVDPRRGQLVWIWPGLPGSTLDLTAARVPGSSLPHSVPAWSCWPTRATRGPAPP